MDKKSKKSMKNAREEILAGYDWISDGDDFSRGAIDDHVASLIEFAGDYWKVNLQKRYFHIESMAYDAGALLAAAERAGVNGMKPKRDLKAMREGVSKGYNEEDSRYPPEGLTDDEYDVTLTRYMNNIINIAGQVGDFIRNGLNPVDALITITWDIGAVIRIMEE